MTKFSLATQKIYDISAFGTDFFSNQEDFEHGKPACSKKHGR
jgi:hypothetical protein